MKKTPEGALIDDMNHIRNTIVTYLFLPKITVKNKQDLMDKLKAFNTLIQLYDIRQILSSYPPELSNAVDYCLDYIEGACFKYETEGNKSKATQIRGFGINFKDEKFTQKIHFYKAVAPELPVFKGKPITFDQIVSGFISLLWQWKTPKKKPLTAKEAIEIKVTKYGYFDKKIRLEILKEYPHLKSEKYLANVYREMGY